jgi:hypothetical protein
MKVVRAGFIVVGGPRCNENVEATISNNKLGLLYFLFVFLIINKNTN